MRNTYKILVIEDDRKLRLTMEDYLSENGFTVLVAENGPIGLSLFKENKEKIDVVLLDGMLPQMGGFEVLKKIRQISDVLVIMVSARESEEAQLQGFRLGVDSYITKPFLLSVLKEQILALIARTSLEEESLVRGALRIDTRLRRVFLGEQEIETTPKEYDILVYFIKNEKIVLDRNTILDAVWGMDYYGDHRTVDTIVKQLRKKLTSEHPYIKSIYGVGYYFEV